MIAVTDCRPNCGIQHRGAFTLVELLTVIAIVAVLMGILVPVLSSARASARKVACLSNLRQIGVAIHSYSDDYSGNIPFGPKAPPFLSPTDFYSSTGAVTSLISLRTGAPVGLGLLLESYLSSQPTVLFCPDSDQRFITEAELAKVGISQAQCSYYYRHASVTSLFDSGGSPDRLRDRIVSSNLGRNRNGKRVRALAIDTMFLCPGDLAEFNVMPRTHHRQEFANILFADGNVASSRNKDGRFTVDIRNYSELRDAYSKILEVLEHADEE
ncbi:MAG: DUF1559 domain-containing protein [Phycisphaerales bacterium]|nr:MAG: DUF1559 domain-containing protein [Phycisphaerales bacterium]